MAALNDADDVIVEGNWSLAGWQNAMDEDSDLETFIDGLLDAANAELQVMLPSGFYAAHVGSEPYTTLLTRAEMHLVQAELLDCAAAITETSDDDAPSPFLGESKQILAAAERKRTAADRLVTLMLAKAGVSRKGPVFVATTTTGSLMELLDPRTGDDGDPFDGT